MHCHSPEAVVCYVTRTRNSTIHWTDVVGYIIASSSFHLYQCCRKVSKAALIHLLSSCFTANPILEIKEKHKHPRVSWTLSNCRLGRGLSVWVEPSIRKCVSGGKGCEEETLPHWPTVFSGCRCLPCARNGAPPRVRNDGVDGIEEDSGEWARFLRLLLDKRRGREGGSKKKKNFLARLRCCHSPLRFAMTTERGGKFWRTWVFTCCTWKTHVSSRPPLRRESPSNSVSLQPEFKWIYQRLAVAWH